MFNNKNIVVLELGKISLDMALSNLQINKNADVSVTKETVIVDPYNLTVTECKRNECEMDKFGVAGMEDIHYLVDVSTIVISNIESPQVDDKEIIVKLVEGKRYRHYFEKDFTLVYMDGVTGVEMDTYEYFCGEYSDGVINIPYQINNNCVLADLIANICVYNN